MSSDQWVTSDVASHLGVGQSTVRAYLARRRMPQPDGRLGGKPWWRPETIREWRPEK